MTSIGWLINIAAFAFIAKIGYDLGPLFGVERWPIPKAVIAVVLYFFFIWLIPLTHEFIFAALSIGFAVACARVVVRQSREAALAAQEDERFMFGDDQRRQ